jgi:hypothetical protein
VENLQQVENRIWQKIGARNCRISKLLSPGDGHFAATKPPRFAQQSAALYRTAASENCAARIVGDLQSLKDLRSQGSCDRKTTGSELGGEYLRGWRLK